MPKTKDNIDIILPNFNSSKFISQTIKSIMLQNYKNWKLIIVDDCSNKETKNILKEYSNKKKIKIFWQKKNRGAGFCRNYGIKKSNSTYIAFIDSDDIWRKNKLIWERTAICYFRGGRTKNIAFRAEKIYKNKCFKS